MKYVFRDFLLKKKLTLFSIRFLKGILWDFGGIMGFWILFSAPQMNENETKNNEENIIYAYRSNSLLVLPFEDDSDSTSSVLLYYGLDSRWPGSFSLS